MRPVQLEPAPHPTPICENFEDRDAVVRYERQVRIHRAYTDPFLIVPLDGRVDGTYQVKGPSGADYLVDIVDRSGEHDTCTCLDYLGNQLGTCKHLEATRRAIAERRSLKSALARLGDSPEGPVLTVDACSLKPRALGRWSRPEGRAFAQALSERGASLEVGSLHNGVRVVHATAPALAAGATRELLRRDREEMASLVHSDAIDPDVLERPLFPYQRRGVIHLLRAVRAILADDMGLGKTVQAIAACEVLRQRGLVGRILVVTVASLKHQWAQEIRRYAGEHAVVVKGNAAERRRLLASDAAYTIINYEQTFRDLSPIRALTPDVLILDEAQRAKNFRSKTAAMLRAIPSRRLFILTGTPVENRLDDLYALMQLVDPTVFGPLWQFNLDFHEQNEWGRITGYKNLGALRQRVAPIVLRRRKEEVLLDLPPRMEQTRYTPLGKDQADLEAAFRGDAAKLLAIAERRPLRKDEQERLMMYLLKARQACNALELCDPKLKKSESPKLDELEAVVTEILAEGSNKILIFSEWVKMLELAAQRLSRLDVRYEMLHGGVPTDKRPALLDRFRDDPAVQVLLSSDAGGVGLNLQAASYVIHLDLPWNPARLDQRSGRAHRLGQTRGVFVTYLCSETGIERGIEGTLHRKREVRSAALDPDAQIEHLDAPSFSAFARQIREILEDITDPPPDSGRPSTPPAESANEVSPEVSGLLEESPASVASMTDGVVGQGNGIMSENGTAPVLVSLPRAPEAPSKASSTRDPDMELAPTIPPAKSPLLPRRETKAQSRLRLSRLVLDAGFLGDALRAAYEALFAAIAGLATAAPPESHAELVALVYRELLPSGKLPMSAHAALAKLHDLTTLERSGVPLDRRLADEALAEADAWVKALDKADGEMPSDRALA